MTFVISCTDAATTVQDFPNWLPPILGAVTGGLMGGLVSLFVGPTKAEREERGKKRIKAREVIGSALRNFRNALSEYRLNLYELDKVEELPVVRRATSLGVACIVDGNSFNLWERRLLMRRVKRLLGSQIMTSAALAPTSLDETMIAVRLESVAKNRQPPNESYFSEWLLRKAPTDSDWDKVLVACDRIRRRYP